MKVLHRIATVFVVAVLLNYVWEIAQMPLYQRQGSWLEQAAHCFVPSLGDGILVLSILEPSRTGDWCLAQLEQHQKCLQPFK